MDNNQLNVVLSDQQREQYLQVLRNLVKHAEDVAEALETGNNEKLIQNFLLFSLMFTSTQDLGEIIIKAVLGNSLSEYYDFSDLLVPM